MIYSYFFIRTLYSESNNIYNPVQTNDYCTEYTRSTLKQHAPIHYFSNTLIYGRYDNEGEVARKLLNRDKTKARRELRKLEKQTAGLKGE